MRRVLALVLALSSAGCAYGQRLVASTEDYAAYRASRVSPTLSLRIGASQRYLERYPDGAFASEVRTGLGASDDALFASRKNSIGGLADYLHVAPLGAHAREAADELLRLRAADAAFAEQGVAEAAERQHARTVARRSRVRDLALRWVSALFQPEVFRVPLAEAPPNVIVPWSLALPEPLCEPIFPPVDGRHARCSKSFVLPYSVVKEGNSEERAASIVLALFEDATGRVVEAELSGPDLFVHLEEARTGRPVSSTDPAASIEAVASGIETLRAELGKSSVYTPSCERSVEAPVVMGLRCGGLDLSVETRPRADVIVITASPVENVKR